MTRQKLDSAPRTRIVIDLSTIDLRVGDEVGARKDDGDYEVGAVEVQQGRVQVADTSGNVHTYHENETVSVIRLK